MITLGPYAFSDQDVARTLRHGVDLIDLITDGLGPVAEAAAAPHRVAAEEVLSRSEHDPGAALGVLWDEWRSAMAAVRGTGAFGAPAVGTVTGLFLSDGGVPKTRVARLEVDWAGAIGDRQADRKNHGRPWQALCLWSTESIDHFRSDGHPVAPGLAGENVSITGLDWARVRPGVQVLLGDVRAEVSSYAIPCKKNAAWFVDGRFDAMHPRHGIHSRVYATVLEPGAIAHGDAVLLEPPD